MNDNNLDNMFERMFEDMAVVLEFRATVEGTQTNVEGTKTAIKAGLSTLISEIANEFEITVKELLEDLMNADERKREFDENGSPIVAEIFSKFEQSIRKKRNEDGVNID